jgi:hypothetical protein
MMAEYRWAGFSMLTATARHTIIREWLPPRPNLWNGQDDPEKSHIITQGVYISPR